MPIFLTEYFASNEHGRVCKMDGGNIEAESFEEANAIAETLGVTVVGKWVCDIEAPELNGWIDSIQKQRDEEWKT